MLARIERINPVINAYCTMTATEAMDEARRAEAIVMTGRPLGDLHGIPVSIKDLALTKGVRTMAEVVPSSSIACPTWMRRSSAG